MKVIQEAEMESYLIIVVCRLIAIEGQYICLVTRVIILHHHYSFKANS